MSVFSGSADAETAWSNQCETNFGTYEATCGRILFSPALGKTGGEVFACCFCFCCNESIHREDKRGELASSLDAWLDILVFFCFLLAFEYLEGVSVLVGRGVRVGDPNIKNCGRPTLPKVVDGHVTSCFKVLGGCLGRLLCPVL